MIVKVEYILIFIVILYCYTLLCYNLFSSCGCGIADGFSVGGQYCNDKSTCDFTLTSLCENKKSINNKECLKCINDNQEALKLNQCNQTDFNNFCIREDYSNKYKDNNFSDVDFTACSEDKINDIAFIFNNDIKTRQNFENASFVNSYIMFVDFSDLNLENANFKGADISNSNFKNTNLKNANLKDVINKDVSTNLCNDSTILDGTGYTCRNGFLFK